MPATAETGSLFFLSEEDDEAATGREIYSFALDGTVLDRINTAGSNWTLSVTNLVIPTGELTGTLSFADATLGARGDRETLANEIATVINTQLISAATANPGTTNPWTVTHQRVPGTVNTWIINFNGRNGVDERAITGTLSLDGTPTATPSMSTTVESEIVFVPGLYIRTAPGAFASNRDWELVAPLNSNHEFNGITFVSDDTRNSIGVARSFDSVDITLQSGSVVFDFDTQAQAQEFRHLFLPIPGGQSSTEIRIQYILAGDVNPTQFTFPAGTGIYTLYR